MLSGTLAPILLSSALAVAPVCRPASGDAAALLLRAATVTGLVGSGGRVLRVEAVDLVKLDYESDRPYPPFLLQSNRLSEWFDPASGADRITTAESLIAGYQFPGSTTLGGRLASYAVRDTTLVASPRVHSALAATRPLNAWTVLTDWRAANDARVVATCEFRGYPRLVLERRGARGPERLLLDPKTGYPVALRWSEPHYLWGRVAVEYVYTTWTRIGDAHLPGAATRMVDGDPEVTRTFGRMTLVPRDSAPALTLPPATAPLQPPIAGLPASAPPDTIRVSRTTFVLKNQAYSEVVTLARDTVFLLDATQGEARARQDSAWIGKLFPGSHPVVVVVTDLAWPHVAGLRYWVAQGATIVSHRLSRPFLERVIDRRWTDSTDLMERRRPRLGALRFRPVADSLRLADGAITVFAIDGVASEGALTVLVRPDAFLWASDFVQSVEEPSQYLDEVVAAVHRMGYSPTRLAAEHLPLTPWDRALRLAQRPPGSGVAR